MRSRGLGIGGLVLVVLVAMGAERIGGRGGLPNTEAIPDILRAGAAALVLFSVSGYALTRLVLPERLRADLALFVLPVGAFAAALALTLLGFLAVPLPVSLVGILVVGAASGFAVRRRLGPEPAVRDREARRTMAWATGLAILATALAVAPLLQGDSFATVVGHNGDAHLATGSAVLLQNSYPTGVQAQLPVDRMPGAWGSKYPIYYVLAGVSELSGLDPIQAFVTLGAVLLALVGLGFLLLARHMLRASLEAALVAMALVTLSEQTLHLVLEPFYNQLWGTLALPFTLLAGWLYLSEPGRGTLALFAPFFVVGSLAYPLLAPFTALFVALAAFVIWRRCRESGAGPGWISALAFPSGRRWVALWVVLGLVLVPIGLGLGVAAASKVTGGIAAALPGGDLGPWSGGALGFLSLGRALGASALPVVAFALLGAAAFAVVRRPRGVALPLFATVGGLLLAAGYMRLRTGGELFVFKALGFGGVMALGLAGVGLVEAARTPRAGVRAGATAVLALALVVMVIGARGEIRGATPHVTHQVAQLREWSDELPPGASVRVDVMPYGVQQWAYYMLADRPVSASEPLVGFFPYAPRGRKADYLLVSRGPAGRPPDASGDPLFTNRDFALYEMRPGVPGPDVSSRLLIDPFVPGDNRRPGGV